LGLRPKPAEQAADLRKPEGRVVVSDTPRMNPYEMVAFIVLIVSVGGVVIVDRFLNAGRHKLGVAEQRIQELLGRIGELERHNDDLRQQLEWSRRLLETQDRVLQQLGPPPNAAELPRSRSG